MNKTERIKALLLHGHAVSIGCSTKYVYLVRKRQEEPSYHAQWMRKKRSSDPTYYEKELTQQRRYKRSLVSRP